MNRLEEIASKYWWVSYELRSPRGAPNCEGITTERALRALNYMDKLRPDDWRLSAYMHVLKYDIIEGNDKWRDKKQGTSSISTLPMKG